MRFRLIDGTIRQMATESGEWDWMEIIATVTLPLNESLISDLLRAGATVFRLNGAHFSAEDAGLAIRRLRGLMGSAAKILLDLPTNKLRTRDIPASITFRRGDRISLQPEQLNFPDLYQYVQLGDEVTINDGRNHLNIVQVDQRVISFEAQNDGQLGSRRGLIFSRLIQQRGFPLLFPHDRQLLTVCATEPVDLIGISYLRYPEQKQEVREAAPGASQFVWKIETREALQSLEDMVEPGDILLIDRGDLAGEIGLIEVVRAQQQVFRLARTQGCRVFVATQFLGSMMQHPVPSLSDVHSLYETVLQGASGIQLSEETAQGAHPIECVDFVQQIDRYVRRAAAVSL